MEEMFQQLDISERYSSALRRQRNSESGGNPARQTSGWTAKARKAMRPSVFSVATLVMALAGGLWLWRQSTMKTPMEFE